ncbi:response regulator [Nitrogeniibacter mangrovi]|uniref:histidine kinase n=1 Tax=Nitrogeniibacter mangrovi TaxID=2016596 RepID=A0A6C1B5J6_9RHOO|nr:response regulator [Nitrogeniibacter mangrovi]QID18961.1 response regulator [Nitrogeniibacter mangrovi]
MSRLSFRDRSLGDKLWAIVLAGIAVALAVSFLTVVASEFRQEFGRVRAQANIYADLVIENGSAPMRFEDVASAERLLGSLRHVEAIRAAMLLRNDGEVFATYPADLPKRSPRYVELAKMRARTDGQWDFPRYTQSWPVLHDGERLGYLVLDISLAGTISELVEWILLACAGLVVGGLAATLLVRRAEHSIVRPILSLAAMVRNVRNQGRYDLRAPVGPRDEVGDLIDGVNSMLSEIEARDSALAAHRDRLEIEVAHRTEELSAAKEEADQARDQAQAASRAKSLFLANMSHEIRTPMNGVLGMIELLRNTPVNERQARMIDTLHGSAESLLYLINDVLDVSKIEAGKLELDPVDFSPARAVEDVALLFAERAQQKGVELVLQVAPDVPALVSADSHRFRQVLNNLVSNAVKFTAAGHILVAIDARCEGESVRLEVRVEDSGIGIPADMMPRLFQAFSQADSSMARRYGGSGLGLAISRQLVQLMGGELRVKSEAGQGACFSFAIDAGLSKPARSAQVSDLAAAVVGGHPVQRAALGAQIRAMGAEVNTYAEVSEVLAAVEGGATFDVCFVDGALSGEIGHARVSSLLPVAPRLVALTRLRSPSDESDARQSGAQLCLPKPVLAAELAAALTGKALAAGFARHAPAALLRTDARVLVAEDHPVNAEIVCALLGECGCRVTVANNGREAVAAYGSGAFDLVLMDIQMPELDGIEATRQIRAIERESGHERVPVIALTANALGDDRNAALGAGMDDYLTKPVTGERLRGVLARWVSNVITEEAPALPTPAPGGGVSDAPEPEAPVLDMAVLLGVPGVNGNREAPLLGRLVKLFVKETTAQLDALVAATAEGQAEQAQRIAHKVKSAAAAVGAARLAAQARELDAELRQGMPASAGQAVEAMRASFAAYANELESSGFELDRVTSPLRGAVE